MAPADVTAFLKWVPEGCNLWSSGWKDVTLKIYGTDEQLTIPVMVSSRVGDVKLMLAEMIGDVNPSDIHFVYKLGCSYKRHRDGDHVNCNLLVKGIKSFAKKVMDYPLPYCVIGAGHMGLRQAVQYARARVDWVLFERQPNVGGNAWLRIANRTSKLQSEGPLYQLQYSAEDGVQALLPTAKYPFWPTREQVLENMREICDTFSLQSNMQLSTEVTFMEITSEPRGADFRAKYYNLYTKSTKEGSGEEGVVQVSNICYYPGCLVVAHRRTWPGEDTFAGQTGYANADEFDYGKVKGQQAVIIGMGASSHESVKTFCEFGGQKIFHVARHFNLTMPRMVSWWINQSTKPLPAALVLDALKPMYKVVGWDPWEFSAVTTDGAPSSAGAPRTASVKQFARWGITDAFFLAVHFGRAEVLHAEVKRLKPRSAVLTTGRVLEDVDHVIKALGFDGDFGVDRLMKTTLQVGPWPEGDWRRFVLSDMTGVETSRFGLLNFPGPAMASMAMWTLWLHQHPADCRRILDSNLMPTNRAEPELGSPAYQWEPAAGAQMVAILTSQVPEIMNYEDRNRRFKHDAMLHLAGAEAYLVACREDWQHYCKLFKDQGCEAAPPEYPFQLDSVQRLLAQEEALAAVDESPEALACVEEGEGEAGGEDEGAEDLGLVPGTAKSFGPARAVLKARTRNALPAKDAKEVKAWLGEGHAIKDELVKTSPPRTKSPGWARRQLSDMVNC